MVEKKIEGSKERESWTWNIVTMAPCHDSLFSIISKPGPTFSLLCIWMRGLKSKAYSWASNPTQDTYHTVLGSLCFSKTYSKDGSGLKTAKPMEFRNEENHYLTCSVRHSMSTWRRGLRSYDTHGFNVCGHQVLYWISVSAVAISGRLSGVLLSDEVNSAVERKPGLLYLCTLRLLQRRTHGFPFQKM